MKKRTLCLLLAGMMALSLLSGCGGKTAGGQPNTPNNPPAAGNDNVPNNEAPMVPPDDWEETTQPEDEGPFPRDPRWDELQPGETAVQYYDIFIKSGMTVGEVVEAVESSDVYNDQFITWEIPRPNGYGETNFTNLDNELTCKAPKEVFIMMPDGNKTLTENGYSVKTESISIKCDDKTLMYAVFPTELPGEEGTTYLVRDMPIILVRSYDGNNDVLTFMGTVGEIKAMNKDDLTGCWIRPSRSGTRTPRWRRPGNPIGTHSMAGRTTCSDISSLRGFPSPSPATAIPSGAISRAASLSKASACTAGLRSRLTVTSCTTGTAALGFWISLEATTSAATCTGRRTTRDKKTAQTYKPKQICILRKEAMNMSNFTENRYKIAKIIAAVASVFGVIGLAQFFEILHLGGVGEFIGGFAVILSFAAYIFGGFGQAFKSAASIAKWGWVVTPFPIDLLTFLFALLAAIVFFLFLPIIPVMKAAKEHANQ